MTEMTEEVKTDGQTSAVSGNADYSKSEMLAELNEIFITEPIDLKAYCLKALCCICENACDILCDVVDGPNPCDLCCCCNAPDPKRCFKITYGESKDKIPLFDIGVKAQESCFTSCIPGSPGLTLNATLPEEKNGSIFMINKPFRMGCCCCNATSCCGGEYMEILIGNALVGSIQEESDGLGLRDANDQLVYIIKLGGGCCSCNVSEFDIIQPDGNLTGKAIINEDTSKVEFPDNSPVSSKLLLISAAVWLRLLNDE
eukprot:CAMPEP_0201588626 /NCGR_PEP_ID=MMETSP0190_2-20130828/157270_1 /ASSEMBLY_ACC=CAM_ASM_000263 /TAXON_ID=37353 /ORGANISM="Rosalina sp." /LENGTH=256 /DNA_ID=CAMNT_0048041151 /DNA_START=30 /DNA_END=800 /DNA_ORIENTATION=+